MVDMWLMYDRYHGYMEMNRELKCTVDVGDVWILMCMWYMCSYTVLCFMCL